MDNPVPILIQLAMLDEGIAPSFPWQPVSLDSLGDDEKKTLRRKFRKLWKKAFKEKVQSLKSNSRIDSLKFIEDLKIAIGWGCAEPSASQKRARRELVYQRLLRTHRIVD
jgi:hypothetical protein